MPSLIGRGSLARRHGGGHSRRTARMYSCGDLGLPHVNDIAVGIALMIFGRDGPSISASRSSSRRRHPSGDPSDGGATCRRCAPPCRSTLSLLLGVVLAPLLVWAFGHDPLGPGPCGRGRESPTRRAPWAIRSMRIRIRATMLGSVFGGIGGSFLSLYYPGSWNEGTFERAGADGGRTGHLRALESDVVPLGVAVVWRGRLRSGLHCSRSA